MNNSTKEDDMVMLLANKRAVTAMRASASNVAGVAVSTAALQSVFSRHESAAMAEPSVLENTDHYCECVERALIAVLDTFAQKKVKRE